MSSDPACECRSRRRRVLLGLTVALALLALSGCAQPEPDLVAAEVPDLTGVAFDVHQEPG